MPPHLEGRDPKLKMKWRRRKCCPIKRPKGKKFINATKVFTHFLFIFFFGWKRERKFCEKGTPGGASLTSLRKCWKNWSVDRKFKRGGGSKFTGANAINTLSEHSENSLLAAFHPCLSFFRNLFALSLSLSLICLRSNSPSLVTGSQKRRTTFLINIHSYDNSVGVAESFPFSFVAFVWVRLALMLLCACPWVKGHRVGCQKGTGRTAIENWRLSSKIEEFICVSWFEC